MAQPHPRTAASLANLHLKFTDCLPSWGLSHPFLHFIFGFCVGIWFWGYPREGTSLAHICFSAFLHVAPTTWPIPSSLATTAGRFQKPIPHLPKEESPLGSKESRWRKERRPVSLGGSLDQGPVRWGAGEQCLCYKHRGII